MSPVGYVANFQPQNDFRSGAAPVVIHIDTSINFVSNSFGLTGFSYVVPSGRRAVVEHMNVIVTASGTVGPGGNIQVTLNYIRFGGLNSTTQIMRFEAGDGPGRVNLLSLKGGQMMPQDRWQVFFFSTNSQIIGEFRTTLHGIEYAVTDPCAPCIPAGGGGGG